MVSVKHLDDPGSQDGRNLYTCVVSMIFYDIL